MSDGGQCEFARSRSASRTAGDRNGPRGTAQRALLRTADGVRIDAAYEPYAGSADPGSSDAEPLGPGAIVLAHGFSGSVDRPALRRAALVFAQYGAVVTFSFRGHGDSGGHSTVGDREVLDLAAAVSWARSMGHTHVTTVGFSMGGSVVVRHGALYRPYDRDADPQPAQRDQQPVSTEHSEHMDAHKGRTGARPDGAAVSGQSGPTARSGNSAHRAHSAHADAVVAVSAPARWYYRGTAPMRRLHWVIERPVGRLVSRYGLRTRIHPRGWDPVPLSPVAAAPALAPTPLLIVHGDQDSYFPLDHPRSLAAAADPACTELWTVPGFGHAENAAEPWLLHRIGSWINARRRGRPHGPA